MFLVKALISGLFFSLLAGCASTDQPNISGKEVIVVGAGIAGLNAARLMQEQGFTVTVLESRERIGGRLWSDKSIDEVTLDLGASWIHGIQFNPIHKLAKDNNITMIKWDYDDSSLYDNDGNEISVQEARIEALNSRLEKYVYNPLYQDLSIDEVIDVAGDAGDLDGYSDVEINYFVSANVEGEFAGPSNKLSVAALNEGSAFGGDEVIFPGGYDQLTTILARNLTILTNHKVTEINYESSRPIVKTNNKTFEADRVLVTVPLGILKRNIIEFSPALPTNKTQAIQSLDMGTLNKVYLKFPTAFWQTEAKNLGYMSDPKGQFNYWLNLVEATGQPVLLAFTAADYGKAMENFSDEEIVTNAMTVLRKIYGNNIPDPEQHVITRWASDPHSYGSYSFLTTEADSDMREALAEPVQSKIYFAGEATHEDYPATVQGAYLSGEREAQRIQASFR